LDDFAKSPGSEGSATVSRRKERNEAQVTDVSITRDDVRGRARADELSMTDPQKALKVARAIRHPWYRCQALSKVAEHWGTQTQRLGLLEEALAAAQEQQEINRIVTVSAWPLGVMVGIDPDAVREHLQRLVHLANSEEHTLRRADALHWVAFAVRNNPSLLAAVVPSLVQALFGGHGWRIDRLIRATVEIVERSMPEVVDRLIEHHADGSKKRAFVASLRKPRG
jgi:hypothetical protein